MSVASTHAGSGRLGPRGLAASEVGVADVITGRLAPYVGVEHGLASEAASSDGRAREEMVVANLRLVLFWALRYRGRGAEVADLFQEGVLGLMRAVELYDADRGTRFSTYASWRIRARMQALVLESSRWASDDSRLERAILSLEPDEDIDDVVVRESVVVELRRAMDGLDELARRVVALRFGLDGAAPLSLNDAARALRLGSRRVREIETEALSCLAEMLAVADERAGRGVVAH
ncbi:MAG: sigma-70 family RNA polymerase sigma factor [Acidimicrobiales bacterium]